jgi:hypothetical protein
MAPIQNRPSLTKRSTEYERSRKDGTTKKTVSDEQRTTTETRKKTANGTQSKVERTGTAAAKKTRASVSADVYELVNKSDSGKRSVGRLEGETEIAKDLTVRGYIEGPTVSYEAKATAGFKNTTFEAEVSLEFEASLLKAGAGIKQTFKVKVDGEDVEIALDLSADIVLGLKGELKLGITIGPNGPSVSVKGDVFAGAKGSLTGSIGVKVGGDEVFKGSVKLEAGFGAGAGASFEGSMQKFTAKAYAYVGVGVGLEVKGSVNVENIIKHIDFERIGKEVADKLNGVAEGVAEMNVAAAKGVVRAARIINNPGLAVFEIF